MSVPGKQEGGPMTPLYRSMNYFVCATLHFYRDDIEPEWRATMEADPRGNAERFVETHRALIGRISQECFNLFGYSLSHRQMCAGVHAYFVKSQSVATSPAAVL